MMTDKYLSRLACDIFEEMRTCVKTQNFSPLSGLIEELQIMVNRMEASIEDKKDFYRLRKNLLDKTKEIESKNIQREYLKILEKFKDE